MRYEDFLVAFLCLLPVVERSKEFLPFLHGVVGPLQKGWKEECVSKVSSVFVPVGQYRCFFRGGRATHGGDGKDSWEFNATKGYPGEDGEQRK